MKKPVPQEQSLSLPDYQGAAGAVAAGRSGVTYLALGQCIVATIIDAAYAKYVAAPAARWVPISIGLSDAHLGRDDAVDGNFSSK